jgi:hypothetical protein
MGKRKKPKREKRLVPLDEIKQGPLRHKQGLSPLLTELARELYGRVGHYAYPSFEQWELGFMRDSHPWREILIWEAICRAYEAYLAKRPEAASDTEIVPALAGLSTGATLEEEPAKAQELQELLQDAWGKRWTPLVESPLEFPDDSAIVLQYEDIMDDRDGQLDPRLNRAIDPRHALAGAEIILGTDHRSDNQEFFCIYGQDTLDETPGEIPRGRRILAISLDAQNAKADQLSKILAVVKVIKGRHDCG